MNSRDRQFWTEFLLLYRSLPAVWQIQSPDYGSRELKSAGYERLVRKLSEVEPDANRSTVVRKINSFRTNFRRDVRRRDQCLAMGEPFKSTLWYFNLLSFLEGQDTGARSHRTVGRGKSKRSRQSSKDAEWDETISFNSEISSPQKCRIFKEIKEESLPSPESCPSSPAKSVNLENNFSFSTFPREVPEQKSSTCCNNRRLSESVVLTQAWGHQFQELSHGQRTIARKLISDILYYGCMEQLDPSHVDQMHLLMSQQRMKEKDSDRVSIKDGS